jgi:hypothetical protein
MIDLYDLEQSSPLFMTAFDQFSRAFQYFNRFAVVILNSIHADGDPRAHIEQSGVWQTGESLIRDWVLFLTKLYEVIIAQAIAIFPMIVAAVDKVSTALEPIQKLFFVGTLKTVLHPMLTSAIAAEMEEIKQIAQRQSPEEQDLTFDLDFFEEKVRDLTGAIRATYLGPMPRYIVTTAEIMLKKMQLKIAVQELEKRLEGLRTFAVASGEVKRHSMHLNQQITELCEKLGLPWRPELKQNPNTEIEINEADLQLKPPPRPFARTASPRSPRRNDSFRNKK